MDTSTISALKFFAIGTATKDNVDSKSVIQVNPTEHLPAQTGIVNDSVNSKVSGGVDPFGNKYSDTTKTSTSIPCTWLDLSFGNLAPPCVRTSERILIWREGDSKKYYWSSMNMDLNRRRSDRLHLGVSDVPESEKGLVGLHLGNTYSILFNTFNKTIRLGTAKSDGERWMHELWMSETAISIKDDVGNEISVDSEHTIVRMKNADGSYYELNKEDINEFCKGSKVSTIGGDLTESVTGNVLRKVKGNVTNDITGNVIDKMTDWSVTTKGAFNHVAVGGYNVTTATATFSGIVKMAAFTSAPGGGGAKAGAPTNKIVGGLDVDLMQVIQATIGQITTQGITSSGNVTAPNIK